jgi:hypothetical protein
MKKLHRAFFFFISLLLFFHYLFIGHFDSFSLFQALFPAFHMIIASSNFSRLFQFCLNAMGTGWQPDLSTDAAW